ncbi:MAG: sulfatase-like hydrolase/transferase [Clostridia bacterium]|nr:sulfatase-like hydrolase/transferase [Clostridia bacterium]
MKTREQFPLRTLLRQHEGLRLAALAFLLELALESLHRHSFLGGALLLAENPTAFVFGGAVILLTLSLSLFFRRKAFVRQLIAVLWLAMGIIDCITLFFRTTPLAAIDFLLLDSVWTALPTYLTPWQTVLVVIAIVGAVATLVWAGIHCPKGTRDWRKGLAILLMGGLFLASVTLGGLYTGKLSGEFPNLPDAYRDYGFTYCFSVSCVSLGIDEPEDYSEETMEEILAAIHADSAEPDPLNKPNVIFVQLESVMDVGRIRDLVPSEDPTPTLNALRESCSAGLLTVPSIGAGTANTEFEVITGMSCEYFGAGEYPYKTVLQDTACESLCYNLRELGYACHAVHNHYGSFYDRNQVFSNLGFDTFTSVEYMQNVEQTPRGWATDACLTDAVLAALDSTRRRDFVYTITVQGHGKYDAVDGELGPLPVTVKSGIEDADAAYTMGYYMSLIQGTDRFVSDLLTALEDRAEPTVVVLFGDHLPKLDLEENDLNRGTLLQSEYVIWSNFSLPKQDRDLEAYQLSARVLELLGMENGVITKLHQNYSQSSRYQEALELLEYDLLYGEREAYLGHLPAPTDLQMGITPPRIHYAMESAEGLLVLGEGFTHWSTVMLDGDERETRWVNAHVLLLPEVHPEDACELAIRQAGKDRLLLSESGAYVYQPGETSGTVLPDIPLLPED